MSLEVLMCLPPTLERFVQALHATVDVSLQIVSLEHFKSDPTPFSVVVGKLVGIHELKPELSLTFVAKEVLPDLSYGSYFYVFIEGFLLEAVSNFDLKGGDRMAFLNPSFVTVADPTVLHKGKCKLSHCIRYGKDRSDRMWVARKDPHNQQKLFNSSTNQISSPKNRPSPARATENNCGGKTPIKNNTSKSPYPIIPCKKMKTSEPTKPGEKTDIMNDLARNFENADIAEKTETKQSSKEEIEPTTKPVKAVKPSYSYQTLAEIKSRPLEGPVFKVNAFCVVLKILKPLTTTQTGKFTTIIEAVDETMKDGNALRIHFFTTQDTILKEMSQGDVLRLHRLQMEVFEQAWDGRIFNSGDITLFKHGSSGHISVTDKSITDSEKTKAEQLKTWFQDEYLESVLSDVVPLSEITTAGSYKVLCKVLEEPCVSDCGLKYRVSDGSVISNMWPTLPLVEGNLPLVTVITSEETTTTNVKMNDFVLFSSVDVELVEGTLKLTVSRENRYKLVAIKKDHRRAVEVERLIAETKDNQLTNDRLEFNYVMECDDMEPLELNEIDSEDADMFAEDDVSHENQQTPPREEPSSSTREECQNRTEHHTDMEVESEVENAELIDLEDVTECENPELNNSQGQLRKTLFTANNGDWSDATEEPSENTPPQSEEVKDDDSAEVLVPADKSMSSLFVILRDQYCSPRKLPTSTVQESPTKSGCNANCKPLGERVDLNENSLRTAQKKKLFSPNNGDWSEASDEKTSSSSVEETSTLTAKSVSQTFSVLIKDLFCSPQGLTNAENSTLKDSTLVEQDNGVDRSADLDDTLVPQLDSAEIPVSADCQDDVSTVINLSCHTVAAPARTPLLRDTADQLSPAVKVSSWLQRNESEMGAEEDEELGLEIVKAQVLAEDDFSELIETEPINITVFLDKVIPNPQALRRNYYKLVSGVCREGCQEMCPFSGIDWEYRGTEICPFCPTCNRRGKSMQLTLAFMFDLIVFDNEGTYARIIVCREQAEHFLSCSACDFLTNQKKRERVIQILTVFDENPELGEERLKIEVSIAFVKNRAFLVETKLMLPKPMNK